MTKNLNKLPSSKSITARSSANFRTLSKYAANTPDCAAMGVGHSNAALIYYFCPYFVHFYLDEG